MLYKDPSRSVLDRVEDLLSRMTLSEKVAQLTCTLMISGNNQLEAYKHNVAEGIGTISYLNSSLTGDLHKDRNLLRTIQRFLVEETRLGIPALVHNEGIAGAQIPGATTFPQSIGMAATWDPELAKQMGEVVKKQLLAFGFRAVHSPLFDLARDPRWGRVGETYGEDPYLVAQLGVAFVQGIQGNNELMATAKHFIAYGNSEGGRNGGNHQLSERSLLDTYAFPFEAAIHEAGVMAVMNSYGILNEEPMSTSKWLLTDLLRIKLGFQGVVVADYGSVSHAYTRYRVAKDQKETAILALKAGLDVEQPMSACFKHLVDAVNQGELEESYVDQAVRRILEVKFRLGLFEQPYEIGNFEEEVQKLEYVSLSRNIAEKSMVLLKNEDTILPLKKNTSKTNLKIALIGPTSDDCINFFGGYSSVGSASTTSGDFDRSQQDQFLKKAYQTMITEYKDVLAKRGIVFDVEPSQEQKELIIEGLRQSTRKSNKSYTTAEDFISRFYPDCQTVKDVLIAEFGKENILHAKGCNILEPSEGGLEQVRSVVAQADIVIAVLGGRESMKDPQATEGENNDNINIDLENSQLDMMKEVFQLGKPVISVIVDGRPLAASLINEKSKAVLYSWLPAQAGAEAIVNLITGKSNPSGKLPVTVLKDKGQIPMVHSRLPIFAEIDQWSEYIDKDLNAPLYPFGYGLSYTAYEYSDLIYDQKVASDGKLTLSFKVKNSGGLSGDEVVQVYIRDCVSSVVRPVKQLAGFTRVSLEANEIKEVSFTIDMKMLAFHDPQMNQVVEPGEMELYVGASSEDIRLKGSFEIIGEKIIVERKVFSSQVLIN